MTNITNRTKFYIVTLLLIFNFVSCASKKPVVAEVDASEVYIKNEKQTVDYTPKIKSGICDKERNRFFKMSDAELIAKAIDRDVGNCYYEEPKKCRECECLAYIKVAKAPWAHQGWPLDPDKKDGSGCVSALCGNGYKSIMCETKDLKKNGVEQLRDAIADPHDVCGLCSKSPKITADMVLEN